MARLATLSLLFIAAIGILFLALGGKSLDLHALRLETIFVGQMTLAAIFISIWWFGGIAYSPQAGSKMLSRLLLLLIGIVVLTSTQGFCPWRESFIVGTGGCLLIVLTYLELWLRYVARTKQQPKSIYELWPEFAGDDQKRLLVISEQIINDELPVLDGARAIWGIVENYNFANCQQFSDLKRLMAGLADEELLVLKIKSIAQSILEIREPLQQEIQPGAAKQWLKPSI